MLPSTLSCALPASPAVPILLRVHYLYTYTRKTKTDTVRCCRYHQIYTILIIASYSLFCCYFESWFYCTSVKILYCSNLPMDYSSTYMPLQLSLDFDVLVKRSYCFKFLASQLFWISAQSTLSLQLVAVSANSIICADQWATLPSVHTHTRTHTHSHTYKLRESLKGAFLLWCVPLVE